jgi:hypothetical protein
MEGAAIRALSFGSDIKHGQAILATPREIAIGDTSCDEPSPRLGGLAAVGVQR